MSRQERNLKKRIETELEWIRANPKGGRIKSKARARTYDELCDAAEQGRDAERIQSGAIAIAPGPRLGNKVLTLTNVAVRFGDTPLFKGLTLDLPAGAVMGVVGANGTGKTSLLKLIAGEATPDEGEVSLGGTVRVGYASQTRDGLDDDKSVFEEISQVLPRTFHDLP